MSRGMRRKGRTPGSPSTYIPATVNVKSKPRNGTSVLAMINKGDARAQRHSRRLQRQPMSIYKRTEEPADLPENTRRSSCKKWILIISVVVVLTFISTAILLLILKPSNSVPPKDPLQKEKIMTTKTVTTTGKSIQTTISKKSTTNAITEKAITIPHPIESTHYHPKHYDFVLVGKPKIFNRYPKEGWVGGNHTVIGRFPTNLQCCCDVADGDTSYWICAQGRSSLADYGLEIILKGVKAPTVDGEDGKHIYLVVRHQSDKMVDSKCRATWQ